MARRPAEIQADIAVTRRVIEHQLDAIQRKVPNRWWTPYAVLAGAVAPLFDAAWQHLVIAGGSVFLLALAALAWSAWRLKHLEWPHQTLTSFEENWQWLAAQLRSRLTLR